jgi:hypothetical protein
MSDPLNINVPTAWVQARASLAQWGADDDPSALRRARTHARDLVESESKVTNAPSKERMSLLACTLCFEQMVVRTLAHALVEGWTEVAQRLALGDKVENVEELIKQLRGTS